MALPRPVLLALVGIALIGAALLGTRGMPSHGGETAPAPAPAPAARTAPVGSGHSAPAAPPARARAAESSRAAHAPGAARSAHAPAGPRTARARGPRSAPGLPPRLAKALAAHRTLILFFGQGGADDRATRAGVESARSAGAAVFTADVRDVSRYASLVGGLGLVEAPATVVVGRDRRARLVEGYLDAGSIRQLVADARR